MHLITKKNIFVFLLQFISIFAISASNSFLIKCQSETVFTHDEVQFCLELPNVDISDIQFDMPELPLGVKFISSMKTSSINSSGVECAKIQFWLSFSDSGEMKLSPIIASINNKIVYIPFEKINVFENPAILSPIIFVEFEKDDFSVASEVKFDVYVKYCVQILNFTFNIPKNSIFTEVERDEFTKGEIRKPEFSSQKTKIASFIWKPLISGITPIPEIKIDAIAYNGDRKTISTLDLMKTVDVKDVEFKLNNKNDSSKLFKDAFTETFDENVDLNILDEKKNQKITRKDIFHLVELRCDERHSFPFSNVTKERRTFEEKFGFEEIESEPSVPLFFILSVFSLGAIIFHIIMVLKKHAKSSVFFAILFVLFVVFSIRQNLKIQQEYAISTGGRIYSVPEETKKSGVDDRFIPKGIRLKIIEKVGNWFYIECSEMSGWTKSDSVIIIQ